MSNLTQHPSYVLAMTDLKSNLIMFYPETLHPAIRVCVKEENKAIFKILKCFSFKLTRSSQCKFFLEDFEMVRTLQSARIPPANLEIFNSIHECDTWYHLLSLYKPCKVPESPPAEHPSLFESEDCDESMKEVENGIKDQFETDLLAFLDGNDPPKPNLVETSIPKISQLKIGETRFKFGGFQNPN